MNDKEVMDLIKLQLDTGTDQEKILDFLKKNGLTEADALKTMEFAKNRVVAGPEVKPELPKMKTTRYWIVFVIMIILLAITGMFYLFLRP